MVRSEFCYKPAITALKHQRLKDCCILLVLFLICILFYYFGEIVDIAGWTALRWDFFYTVHDLHRLLFLAPIIYASYSFRVKGVGIATFASFVIFLPRALFISPFPDSIIRMMLFTIIAGIMGILVGITRNQAAANVRLQEQHQAVDRLLQISEERYRQIFQNAYDAIWINDMEGNITSVNDAATRLVGYRLEDLSPTSTRTSLTSESLHIANEVRTKLLRGEPVVQPYEQRLVTKQGTETILKITTNVVEVDGRATGFQHIARDVTQELQEAEQRKHLEALVKGERDKLFGILEKMRDGVFIVGPDYRILFMNSSMIKTFGEGTGLPCYKHLHQFRDPCDQICQLPTVIDGSTERWEYHFPDGRTYDVIASPFIDSDGVVCQLSTLRDITERKQVELELIKLNQLKSDLLSNVSHEFKSPLTSIKGIISSLLQKDIKWDDDTREMLLEGISEETDRLASLVTNLLNMSKLEAGVWHPEKERCHIVDIVNQAVEHQRWVHKKLLYEAKLKDEFPDMYIDRNQIRQVLINLLENASAYSEEGTKIAVDAKIVDGKLEVSVSDQGIGIPSEDLGKIFDKFYRGSQQRHKPGGTGLGLAICQAIIAEHGGKIWAESRVGQGSTFYFTLPMAQPNDK